MKTHLALGGLVAAFVLHSAQAAQPSHRAHSQNRNRAPQAESEEGRGVRGFFRGVYGEIKEGGKVIAGGYREVRDGIKSKVRGEDDEPEPEIEPRGRSRYGYQSPPPPPVRNPGGLRAPRDPGPPSQADVAASRSRQESGESAVSAQSSRERTLPRLPAPAPERAPLPPSTGIAAPEPPANRYPAPVNPPVRRESPVVDSPPPSVRPEIVAPKKPETSPTPDVSAPAPDTEETPALSDEQSKPIARDEKGRPLPDKPDFPTATATKDPGVVLSPYPPYDLLDVKGMAPGSLAKDPATGQIFRVP